MEFKPKYFNPHSAADLKVHNDGVVSVGKGDAPGDVYVYTPATVFALNVALATSRPLLVTGEPGSGKTTLAQNAAHVLGWWFYRETVTSRLQATDLFYTFDALRRLNDANTPNVALPETEHYVQPGVLWWAFDPASAPNRGAADSLATSERAVNPGTPTPDGKAGSAAAVVVVDEIDKADPDVPNDLLEAFDTRRFVVREIGITIEAPRNQRTPAADVERRTRASARVPPALRDTAARSADGRVLRHGRQPAVWHRR